MILRIEKEGNYHGVQLQPVDRDTLSRSISYICGASPQTQQVVDVSVPVRYIAGKDESGAKEVKLKFLLEYFRDKYLGIHFSLRKQELESGQMSEGLKKSLIFSEGMWDSRGR